MEIEKTAQEFSTKLAETETFKTLKQKRKNIRKDKEARNLLNSFETKQEECQNKQANGNLTREDLQQLKQLRRKMNNNDLIAEYQKAIGDFQEVCQESVQQLSSLMGMDVASYLVQGCC